MKNDRQKMESTEPSFNQQSILFGGMLRKGKKTGDICSGGPSGVFRQNSDLEKSQRPGALSSCARAARESIGGIGNLISRKMASAGIPPPGPWPNKKQDYDVGEVIGAGATAIVHYAFCKPREEKCAIKKIYLEKWNTNMDELLKEIQAMSNCNHENIVTYYTSFVVKDELWLVLKLLEGGSLLDIIKHKLKAEDCQNGVFDECVIATILRETLKGLEYFHKNGQIHRDIKAGNILLSADGNVQIGDFGVSAWLATGRDMSKPFVRNTFVGTPCWMAPEVMEQDHGYDFKADIWSFGITAIELATGRAPYHKYPPMKVLMLTLQNEPPTLDYGAETKDQYKAYGKSFRKMINDCLQKDPKKRPTASELLQHPFFKKSKDRRFLSQYMASISNNPINHKVNRHVGLLPPENNNCMNIEWLLSDDDEDNSENKISYINSNDSNSPSSISSDTTPSTSKTSKKDDLSLSALSFVLRIRNKTRQLDDIKFEFVPGKDKAGGIASELESAGLIDPLDVEVIADNLNTLVCRPLDTTCTSVTFPLNSPSPGATFNSKVLLGYAQLSVEL